MSKILFCFDFDGTLIGQNLHRMLDECYFSTFKPASGAELIIAKGCIIPQCANARQYNANLISGFVSQKLKSGEINILHKAQYYQLFSTILSQGHHIAITSFNAYPHAIIKILIELGLNTEQLQSINIICGQNDTAYQKQSKNLHIKKAKLLLESEAIAIEQIILIDDSLRNCNAATAINVRTILAGDDEEYFSEIYGILNNQGEQVANSDHFPDIVGPQSPEIKYSSKVKHGSTNMEYNQYVVQLYEMPQQLYEMPKHSNPKLKLQLPLLANKTKAKPVGHESDGSLPSQSEDGAKPEPIAGEVSALNDLLDML